MDNMDNMENLENTTTHYCGYCKRKLPLDAFYFNKRKQSFDRYCKDCRKAKSRDHYKTKEDTRCVNNPDHYPVITRTEDPEKRRELIHHSMQIVIASVLRKKKKLREAEAMTEK